VEAASLPRSTVRHRRPTWKALLALVLYAASAVLAWTLVSGARSFGAAPPEAAEATSTTQAVLAPTSTDLALGTIATRAARSVGTVGDSAGFVGWTAPGMSLVVTARPPGGWETGPRRAVEVALRGNVLDGTLVRSNGRTGLGLVRVAEPLPRPLWQERRPALVQPGDALVAVTADGSSTFTATAAGRLGIWGLGRGVAAGAPVVDASGRLVGVTAAGGRVVPIGRACGSIRRC
jgi:hypothetical protein